MHVLPIVVPLRPVRKGRLVLLVRRVPRRVRLDQAALAGRAVLVVLAVFRAPAARPVLVDRVAVLEVLLVRVALVAPPVVLVAPPVLV